MPVSDKIHEQVQFRLIRCPECGTTLCWVNPRLPNYCPECGKHIFTTLKLRGDLIQISTSATLTLDGH